MKPYEKYLPLAINRVIALKPAGKSGIPKQYKGYIAALGGSVRTSGLLPTLAVYSTGSREEEGGNNSGSDFPRGPIIDLIWELLKSQSGYTSDKNLLEYANRFYLIRWDRRVSDQQRLESISKLKKLEEDVMYAAIALKLALRTHKLI